MTEKQDVKIIENTIRRTLDQYLIGKDNAVDKPLCESFLDINR